MYRAVVWFGFVRPALLLAIVLCWVDCCSGSWVLLGLLCFLRVTQNRCYGGRGYPAFSHPDVCSIRQLSVFSTSGPRLHAAEGDLRLVEQSTLSNWLTGRLEIFFEGSWSQVCATNFTGTDADVACRQLGFGNGSVLPARPDARDPLVSEFVYPEVALSAPGCNGSEANLLDCQPQRPASRTNKECLGLSDRTRGLVIGCVAARMEGTLWRDAHVVPCTCMYYRSSHCFVLR